MSGRDPRGDPRGRPDPRNPSPRRDDRRGGGAAPPARGGASRGGRFSGTLNLRVRGGKLKDMDRLSKSDPFLEVTYDDGGKLAVGYRSETVMNNLNPVWKPITVDAAKFCGGDDNRPITLTVYDDESKGDQRKRVMIGECKTTVAKLLARKDREFELFDPKKMKPGAKPHGILYIDEIKHSGGASGGRDDRGRTPSRRSPSPRGRRSPSPRRGRRSPSPRGRRSPSPRRRDSPPRGFSSGDEEHIRVLQSMARFMYQQAQNKLEDAKSELRSAQELMDRVNRLQPRRERGRDYDWASKNDRFYDGARDDRLFHSSPARRGLSRYDSDSDDDRRRGRSPGRRDPLASGWRSSLDGDFHRGPGYGTPSRGPPPPRGPLY